VRDAPSPASPTVFELRRAFDAAFADPPPSPRAIPEYVLAIGLAGDPYALRLTEVAGLFKDRRVTLLPGPLPQFLGVAGIQGRLVPVYDLRRLLGYAPNTNPHWLALILAPEPLGLAFDSFEGQFTAPRERFAAAPAGGPRHLSQVVRTAEILRPIVDVTSVVEAIRSQAGPDEPAKER